MVLACFAIYAERDSLIAFVDKSSWGFISLALVMGVITTYTRCFTHAAFLAHYPNMKGLSDVLHGYLISQIGKYLPGKVFGIVSQSIHLENKAVSSSVVAATINQFVTTNLCAVFISCLIIGTLSEIKPAFSIGIGVLGIVCYFFSFIAVDKLSKHIPQYSLQNQLKIAFWILLEWLFFILAIYFCLPIGASLSDAAFLGAVYAIASIAGSLAIVVPSGLFVREAVFVYCSSLTGFETGDLIGIAIILRIVFTFADIGAYLLFIPVKLNLSTNISSSAKN